MKILWLILSKSLIIEPLFSLSICSEPYCFYTSSIHNVIKVHQWVSYWLSQIDYKLLVLDSFEKQTQKTRTGNHCMQLHPVWYFLLFTTAGLLPLYKVKKDLIELLLQGSLWTNDLGCVRPPWDLDVEGKTFLIGFIDKCFSGDLTSSIGTSFDFYYTIFYPYKKSIPNGMLFLPM